MPLNIYEIRICMFFLPKLKFDLRLGVIVTYNGKLTSRVEAAVNQAIWILGRIKMGDFILSKITKVRIHRFRKQA